MVRREGDVAVIPDSPGALVGNCDALAVACNRGSSPIWGNRSAREDDAALADDAAGVAARRAVRRSEAHAARRGVGNRDVDGVAVLALFEDGRERARHGGRVGGTLEDLLGLADLNGHVHLRGDADEVLHRSERHLTRAGVDLVNANVRDCQLGVISGRLANVRVIKEVVQALVIRQVRVHQGAGGRGRGARQDAFLQHTLRALGFRVLDTEHGIVNADDTVPLRPGTVRVEARVGERRRV